MALKLYNSYGRRVVRFVPLKKGEVRMYTCGPTVWNYAHIGNFRTFVFEDLLRRYLKLKGYSVVQVMNVTDVEDKIIKGIKQFKMDLKQLTSFYEGAFMEDLGTLNVERAEFYPRATEHIPEMVALIHVLLKKGYAYRADEGSVYFRISKFKRYGRLSGIKPSELIPGARVSQDHYDKEQAQDFVLWKSWDEEDGEVFWETELGKGRPGWSIECSAMSMKYLGETFDIHTGGMDNKFPHHENEIAQSEAATGKRFVKYWLHSEFLNISGEEMHKSVGNVVYLRDLVKRGWEPATIRTFLLSAKYRDPLDLNEEKLAQARAQRQRLQDFVDRLASVKGEGQGKGVPVAHSIVRDFEEAMDDDLNTPAALAAVFKAVKRVNRRLDEGQVGEREAKALVEEVKRVDSVLGVLKFESGRLPAKARLLMKQREEARAKKDFATADRLREELRKIGVTVEDGPTGTSWKLGSG